MVKWLTRFVLFILVLAAVAVFLGRPIAEHLVTGRIESKATQAGADIQWGPIQIDGLGAVIPDVRLASKGLNLFVEQIRVQSSVNAAFGSDDWIQSVTIKRPVVRLDLSQRTQNSGELKSAIKRSEARGALPKKIPRVDIVEPKVDLIFRGGQDRVSIDSNRLRIRPVSGGHRFGGSLSVKSTVYGVENMLLSGRTHLDDRSIDYQLQPSEDRKQLISFRTKDLDVDVSHIKGQLQPDQKKASIQLIGLRVVTPRVELRIETLNLNYTAGRISVVATGGGAQVLKATPSNSQRETRHTSSRLSESVKGPLRRALFGFSNMPTALKEQFSRGLTVAWTDFSLRIPRLPRITNAQLRVTEMNVTLDAVVGGGQLNFDAIWIDDWSMFEHGSLKLSGFQLAPVFARRLPSLPPGRTKNNRIDGGIDLEAHLLVANTHGRLSQDLELLFQLNAGWKNGRVDASSVSPHPVTNINLQLESFGQWSSLNDRVHASGLLNIHDVALSGQFDVFDAQTTPLFTLALDGEKTSCADAFKSLPTGLLGPYDALKVSGDFKPYVRLRLPIHRPQDVSLKFRGLIRDCRIDALNAHVSAHPPVRVTKGRSISLDDVTWLNEDFILKVREGVDEGREIFVGPKTPNFVPIDELPAHVGGAAYMSEEMNFYRNQALDPGLIARALSLNLEKGRFVYGGSTVTQQLVKNLFLVRAKSLARKIREIVISKRITQVVSRKRVLELYLNCIEFGPNVFGIGPAARYYFQKDARNLTPIESVFLAMMKPAPRWGAGMIRRGRTPNIPYWDFRSAQILERLVKAGYITSQEALNQKPYARFWVDGRYQEPTNIQRMLTSP